MAEIDKNTRLFVKSYFTHSIAEAIELAVAELGPDALLLNTRPAPPESGHPGQYEVVFGCQPGTSGGGPAGPASAQDPVADLRKRMDEIYAKHTGRSEEEVHRDMERDRFFKPEEAVEYGLIDRVLDTH